MASSFPPRDPQRASHKARSMQIACVPGRLLLIVWIIFLITSKGAAPGKETIFAKNAFYVEVGGQGIVYSVNYERFVEPHIGLSLRTGFTHFYGLTPYTLVGNFTVTAFPVMIHLIAGHGSDHFELVIGAVLGFGVSGQKQSFADREPGETVGFVIPTETLGYRHQPLKGGVVFRAAIALFLSRDIFGPCPAISFGYAF
ncbi:MAG: hypothetical protein ACP5JH_09985 [Bacteroidota bacterium]